MVALTIVEDFDIFKYVSLGFAMSLVMATINQLSLYGREEALHGRVVMSITSTAHAGDHAMIDQQQLVQMAQSLQPDLLLMDINMPGLNGIEATKQITAVDSHPAVLIITMLDDDTVFTAMQAGARGFLLKGAEGNETLRAIRAVANGEVIFSPGVAEQMMYFFRRGEKKRIPYPFPELTPREREILELLARGLTNNAIAEKLVLSPKTIRNQTSTIFSKLQVASRNEAIVKARESGLGGASSS